MEECPTPEKNRYRSEKQARRELKRMWQKGKATKVRLYPYRCRCGWWHWTSTRNYRVKVNRTQTNADSDGVGSLISATNRPRRFRRVYDYMASCDRCGQEVRVGSYEERREWLNGHPADHHPFITLFRQARI